MPERTKFIITVLLLLLLFYISPHWADHICLRTTVHTLLALPTYESLSPNTCKPIEGKDDVS